MSTSTKTTVYLGAAEYEQLKRLARQRKRPAAELVREAVAEYVRRRARRRLRPRTIGAFHSGLRDLGERAEEYLSDMGRE